MLTVKPTFWSSLRDTEFSYSEAIGCIAFYKRNFTQANKNLLASQVLTLPTPIIVEKQYQEQITNAEVRSLNKFQNTDGKYKSNYELSSAKEGFLQNNHQVFISTGVKKLKIHCLGLSVKGEPT